MGPTKQGTWVSRVEVDLKPPVAEVEGTMNEFSHRVLQAEGHERWGKDWESDGHVDEFWDAESLSGLPVDHNDVPEWNEKFILHLQRFPWPNYFQSEAKILSNALNKLS